MQITGKVKQVFPVETRGNFSFRVLWLNTETESQYPQILELQAAQAKTSILDGLNEGDEITCHLNLRGREWSKDGKTSVFNTIQVWKVDKGASAQPAQQAITQSQPSANSTDLSSDMPF